MIERFLDGIEFALIASLVVFAAPLPDVGLGVRAGLVIAEP